MQSVQLQVPLLCPVYQQEPDGSYELENFVTASVPVVKLGETLSQESTKVLCSLRDWIWTACMQYAPCCIILQHNSSQVVAQFHTGQKKFNNFQQCARKLRLANHIHPGSVVSVEGHMYLRSYSVIVSYELDPETRMYTCHSACAVPAKMHHCALNARDKYTLLCVVQGKH